MKNSHPRAPRGDVEGWSEGATRRNTAFLRTIREDQLSGYGYACTLTLKTCPDTPILWHKLRRAWEMRMVRDDMIRLHWVTEWQARGVPHLHCAIWFPTEEPSPILHHWLAVAAPYGAGPRGQHVRPIERALGWFQYVAKHAQRGVRHYQRNSANIPAQWQSKTGRVWGKSGQWPIEEATRIEIDSPGFSAYRRILRNWRIADARSSGDVYRLKTARRMLTCHDRVQSQLRGVSEWIPQHVQLAVLYHLAARGFQVIA